MAVKGAVHLLAVVSYEMGSCNEFVMNNSRLPYSLAHEVSYVLPGHIVTPLTSYLLWDSKILVHKAVW